MRAAQIEFATATDGSAIVSVNGVALHSRYQPAREAQRLAASQLGQSRPEIVILFEPGLGYAAAAIRQQLPDAGILVITYHPRLAARARPILERAHSHIWTPNGEPLDRFFQRHIDDLHIASLAVVDSGTAGRCFPAAHRDVTAALRSLLARQKASFATTVGFGRRWIRNAIVNSCRINRVAALPTVRGPLVVAASGPSLEEVISDLGRLRPLYQLWALPSAVRVLHAAGLEPDLIVATDPGYYAAAHLFRQPPGRVAMPLSAASPPATTRPAVSLFAEGHGFEADVLQALGMRLPVVPPAGTVAASAIRLAAQNGARWVLMAGLDLCYRDLLAHARPSLSGELLRQAVSRQRPYVTQLLVHAMRHAPVRQTVDGNVIRRGAALDAYAGWFNTRGADGVHLARLEPSPIATTGLQPIALAQLEGELQKAVASTRAAPSRSGTGAEKTQRWRSPSARGAAIATLLSGWIRALEAAMAARLPPEQLRDTSVWHLAHYIETAGLLRATAAARNGGEWWSDWAEVLQACRRHVDNLAVRARAG